MQEETALFPQEVQSVTDLCRIEDYIASQPWDKRDAALREYVKRAPPQEKDGLTRRGYQAVLESLIHDLRTTQREVERVRREDQGVWKSKCRELQAQLAVRDTLIEKVCQQKEALLKELRLRAGQSS